MQPNALASARKGVLYSPEVLAAQKRHSRLAVGMPMVLLILCPFLFPSEIPWGLAIFTFSLMCAITGGFGISVGFHRHFSHRSFRAAPWLRVAMAIAGQMAGQGPVYYWTALHRRHHSFSDLPGDPHSPSPRSWETPKSKWAAFLHGHYQWATNHEVPLPARYVPELLKDPAIQKVNTAYLYCFLAAILLPAGIGLLWTQSAMGAFIGFYFGFVLRIVVSTQGSWATNSICHMFGSRPHETNDFSRNNALLMPVTFGECWHNNHHHAPTHARFGKGWTQPDPGWWMVWTLKKLGLVWDVLGEDLSAQHRKPVA